MKTPFSKMTRLRLSTGIEDGDDEIILDIAPTMKKITRGGKTYLRMPGITNIEDDGSESAFYLWDGWMKEKIRRAQESEVTP